MDVAEQYKILIDLMGNVKNDEDKVHLKKEIKKQLYPAFTSREEERISEALACYKIVCQTLKNKDFQWDVLDDIDDLLLSIMENEQVLTLRKCYEEILFVIVSESGLSSLKWSNRLIDIFKDYCRVDTGSGSGIVSLKALKAFVVNTWPRLKENWGKLMTISLECLYDLYYSKTVDKTREDKNAAEDLCIDTISLLHKALPVEIKQFISEILKRGVFESSLNEQLKNIIS